MMVYEDGYPVSRLCANEGKNVTFKASKSLRIVLQTDNTRSFKGFKAIYKKERKFSPTTLTTVATTERTTDAFEIMVCSGSWDTPACSAISVNGVDYSQHKRGYNLVVIDIKTGKVEGSKAFDTHGSYSAGSFMLSYVNRLQFGKIVIAAIHDEGANEMSSWGYDALRRIGGKPPFQDNYRGSFALIGYKGMRDAYVPWIKQGSNERGKGPTVLRASLKFSRE